MEITSPAFQNKETIPSKFTCEGPNVSPPLNFKEVPENTQSLVLIVEDPDAEARPWVHWLVFNIPPYAKGFEENSIYPGSIQGLCNGNTFGYEGPCPSENEHSYLFKLFALDIHLNIRGAIDRKAVLQKMEGHIITQATLTGKYQKDKIKQGQL